ncbi:MAG: site-specific DNA-methyltransferase [Pseudomonadota bacterium]
MPRKTQFQVVGSQDLSSLNCDGFSSLKRIAKYSSGTPGTGNALIQGENLAVLQQLLPRFDSKVRCCYIDPPYNNNEKHYHYADSLDHRTWLDQTTERIEILAEFLRDDGSLWISIDDREVHYLKVACDKILGRKNFVTTIVWQQRTTRENRKVFSNNHEYLLVYAKDLKKFSKSRNSLELTPEVRARYKNVDNDPRGPWQSVSANVQAGHATPAQFYKLEAPNGLLHSPPAGRCWAYSLEKMQEQIRENRVWFGRDGSGVPRLKRFLSEARQGLTPETLWLANEVGTNDEAKKHLIKLFPDESVFDTPKPESLIERVLAISSSPGELVVDAYLGSGTTAAVAHKMNRRFIGIEQGKHAVTHAARRLSKVVRGEEKLGISSCVGWSGGGGFDFYRLLRNE